MILVCFTTTKTPFIGQGRWSWPLSLVNDQDLIKRISDLRKNAQRKIINPDIIEDEDSNPQRIWEDFKSQIHQEAHKTTKEHLNKIRQ
jgi:hypothetical protein